MIGSGTVAPAATRTAPAHWVSAGDVRLLLDCGAGMLHRAAGLGLPWADVTHVAISHFHPDHWGELPMLLFALRWGTLPQRSAPLTVLGPAGFGTRLALLAGAYGDWLLAPDYPLSVVELGPAEEHRLGRGVQLETCKTRHTPESLAYAVRADGARLVYTGDTGPDDALGRWAAGCDLLLAECSLPEDRAIDVHLTPGRAAQLARAAGAGRLVLTHVYPVFGDADPAALAAAAFEGPVVLANDGDRFTLET